MFSQINRPDSCTCTIFSVTYLRQPCYCYTWYRYTNIKGEDNCTAASTIITVTFIFTSLFSVTNHKIEDKLKFMAKIFQNIGVCNIFIWVLLSFSLLWQCWNIVMIWYVWIFFFVISSITYFEAILGRSIIGVTTPGAAPSGLPVMGRGPGSGMARVMGCWLVEI